MVSTKQRERYRLIRYDYYHAGRLLHLRGNFNAAGIMLGYTVETTLKAGLMEVMPQEKWGSGIFKSHDVRKLFSECLANGLFDDVAVSKGFLEHINNNFQRHPSQKEKILCETSKTDIMLANSVDWIYYYDDFVVQLDVHLLNRILDPNISIIYHAIHVLETQPARDILQENAFALLKFDEYTKLLRQNMPDREDHRKQIKVNLNRGPSYYWNTRTAEKLSLEQISNIANNYRASSFKMLKWKHGIGYIKGTVP